MYWIIPQSWVPRLRAASALQPGRHIMVRLFDRDWLLFRTASGEFGS